MDVKTLINFLQEQDEDSLVVMASDAEGNNFSPLSGISVVIYEPETPYSGAVFDPAWSADEACFEEDEWQDFLDTHDRSVALWPIN